MTASPNNKIEDGGPAFPCPATGKVSGDTSMSLRDYFAAHASEEDLNYAAQVWLKHHPDAEFCPREVARFAHADAMIAARKLPAPKPSIPADAVCLFMDGNKWAAVRPDFINLQESPAGFGPTPGEAIASLKADIETHSQPRKV